MITELVTQWFNYYLNDYWESVSDPRTAKLPFVSIGLGKMISIMSSYLILIKIILPSYMKHRKPFSLRTIMLIYNTVMVIANGYLFTMGLSFCKWGLIFLDFNYPDQNDRSSHTMKILRTEWIFWMTRFMDLLDTVFFALRKKDSQITFLHLYHHTVVPILCWLCLKVNLFNLVTKHINLCIFYLNLKHINFYIFS